MLIGNLKSQDEFYLGLHAQLIVRDPLDTYSAKKLSLKRDLDTLRHRTHLEGVTFLTKTLPRLGRAFDRGLVTGRFKIPNGFKKARRNSCIPAFLSAYINLVFSEDGILLDVVPVDAIKHIRQVLYFAFKLEIPYSVSENDQIIDTFKATDMALTSIDNPLALDLLSLAKIITRKVFHDFDHKDILPRHGPGAVATGEVLEEKWDFSRLYNKIHQVYPYYDYYVVGGVRELTDRLDWYKSMQRLESGCAKVVLVPKDSRGPRLISCEPLEYQWIQQGLGRKLQDYLEWTSVHTRFHVNFTRQDINSSLAKASSASQRYATLDLKDASDRVSLELVRNVFRDVPDLLRALEACRSTETRLPDGSVITLKKFAPMGSALCFPVEAYIFWAICVSAVVHGKNLPLQVVEKHVFVYGDDIIIPTDWSVLCIQALESVGLMVNVDKSCITGFFRESCGVDAYNGTDVTPLRLRKRWTDQNSDGPCLATYASIANQLCERGYFGASDLAWRKIENTYGLIPFGTQRSPYPCRIVKSADVAISLNKRLFRHRINKDYQRIEFLLPSLSSRRKKSKLDGWARLLRNMVMPPYGDPSAVVLPRSTLLKRGWMNVA